MAQLKERISSIIDGGIDSSEVSQIEELKQEFSCLSPEARKEVEDMLNEALASASEEAKMAISELKNSICEDTNIEATSFVPEKNGFEGLKKSVSGYFWLKIFFDFFDNIYKDELIELWKHLSIQEIDAVKLIFWERFMKSNMWFSESIANKAMKMLETGDFSMTDKERESYQTEMSISIGMPKKYTVKIIAVKKESPEINLTPSHIERIIDDKPILVGLSDPNEIYTRILKGTKEHAETLWEKDSDIVRALQGNPDKIIQKIQASDFWKMILGFLSLFLPWLKNFLDPVHQENQKRITSLQNLFTLSQDNTSPLSGIFGKEFAESFDSKKVEWFFRYLESEEIDYSGDDFWTELISGKSKDTHIQKISKLLISEYGEKIFDREDTANNGESFAKKLNNLEKLANRESSELAQKELEIAAASLPVITVIKQSPTPSKREEETELSTDKSIPHISEEENSGVWVQETALPEVNNPITQETEIEPVEEGRTTISQETTPEIKAAYVNFRNNVIETSLKNAYSFPITLSYQGKEKELEALGIEAPKSIDFKDGNIYIDGKIFSTKFESFSVTKYGQIFTVNELQIIWNPTLTRNTLELECQTENLGILAGVQKAPVPLEKTKMIEIVHALIKTGKYSGKIPAQNDTPKIDFEIS